MHKARKVIRFDPYLRVADDGLKGALADFIRDLERGEAALSKRVRSRKDVDLEKFRLAIESVLSNLIVAFRRSPTTLLNIPLSNNTLRGSPRYRPVVYGKHFRDLITLLEKLHLIEMVTKGHNVREWNRREITTIRATQKLRKALPLSVITSTDDAFARVDPPETIVLKDSARNFIDYYETANIKRWRKEMLAINGNLRDAKISIIFDEELTDEAGMLVQRTARTLRRIFNNSDWTQGGRLYDGFWETMDRDLRLQTIQIDDEPIANVDFKQFNLRLAYALAKAKPPKGDLYDVTGRDATCADWPTLREARKKLTNAMINRTKPLTRWPGATADERSKLASCFLKGTKARTAADAIRAAHPAISKYFESGMGLSFMRIESDILVAAVLSLIKRGITALPLHDAVLVSARHAETAKAVMQRESRRRIGTAIPVEITLAIT